TVPSDPDTETVIVPQRPGIELTKDASKRTGVQPGDTVTYTYAVTNTGNVTLKNVTVTDDKIPAAEISCPGGGASNVVPSLAPGATVECTAALLVTQAFVDGQVGASWM